MRLTNFIVSLHGKVRKTDLHVKQSRDHMANYQASQSDAERGTLQVQTCEPDPKKYCGTKLTFAPLTSLKFNSSKRAFYQKGEIGINLEQHVDHTLRIKVESSKGHNRVEQILLIGNQKTSRSVKHHNSLVVVAV